MRSRIWLVLFAAVIVGCTPAGVPSNVAEGSEPGTGPADPAATDTATTAGTSAVTTSGPSIESSAVTSSEPSPRQGSYDDTDPEQSCQADTGVANFLLGAGGVQRPVRVMVPSGTTERRLPVVINWHGLGATGPAQAALSGYEDLGEQEGFVVVHPTGQPLEPGAPNSWQLFEEPSPRDDLQFADALFETLEQDWCADPTRIYSTGFSNGGYFTSRLVCERSDRVAAAVSVGGLFHPQSCSPERAVPLMAMHGTADPVVPYDGQGSVLVGTDLAGPGTADLLSLAVPDEFAQFAEGAGCAAEPVRTDLTPEVVRHEYQECDDGVPMIFYELPGVGHTWPGSPYSGSAPSDYTDDISATTDGWEFMRRHRLDGGS